MGEAPAKVAADRQDDEETDNRDKITLHGARFRDNVAAGSLDQTEGTHPSIMDSEGDGMVDVHKQQQT